MKKILITGGSSGIGKALCEFLASKGYDTIGTSRNPKQGSHLSFDIIQLDVTDSNSILTAVKTVKEKWGVLDILINNAGIGFMGPLETAKPEHIKMAWETNVLGAMQVTQGFLPLLKQSNSARIINIGSIGGKMGLPFRGWYCAAKGSLEVLGESLSMELLPSGIQVCTVMPGDVKTDIAKSRLEVAQNELGEYAERYNRMNIKLDKEMQVGVSPIKVAEEVYSLLQRKKMPLKHVIGSWTQKLSPIIKNIIPQRWFQKLILKHYK